jgi:ATP-binding cassette subfamily B protein/subfamily B ATP-binding cassette protein MsbA
VLIDGVNVRTAHLRSLRRHIGIVTQDTQLFDDTVFANIAYGKKGATRDEVIEAAKRAHAHGFIEAFPEGYDKRAGERGQSLSGGQRQRIALARAILRDPSILILDEFTSQIDSESEAEIHAALKEFIKGPPPPPPPPEKPKVEVAVPESLTTGALITPDKLAVPKLCEAGEVAPMPPAKVRTTFLITHRLHTIPEIADRIVVMDAGKVVDVGTHAELLARCEVYQRLHQSAQFRKAA